MSVKRINDSGLVEIYGGDRFWYGAAPSNADKRLDSAWVVRELGPHGRIIKRFESDGRDKCEEWLRWADEINELDACAAADAEFDGGEFSGRATEEVEGPCEPLDDEELREAMRANGNDTACPGCGCEPGDGLTEGCDDPDGCGYFRAMHDGEDVGPMPGTGEYSDSIPRE